MPERDLSVEATLKQIKEHQDRILSLQENLVTRARLQSYTQQQLDSLIDLANEGISLLSNVRLGDRFDEHWIIRRDKVVRAAQQLIEDTYGDGIRN